LPAFSAESVVEALDFSFKPYTAAEGTIKEPSDKQIASFLTGIKKVVKESEAKLPSTVDASDPAAVMEALDDLAPEDVVSLMGKMAGLYADLCSGDPTKAQILALPMRVRQQFFTWLQTEVMSPEAAPGAGKTPVRPALRAAAG
jgi:hypothetical protein